MSLAFLRDRAFLREMLTIAIPISFQQLVNASLNMIDVIMVGQLGEATIAALGLANQYFSFSFCSCSAQPAVWPSSPRNSGASRRLVLFAKCWV